MAELTAARNNALPYPVYGCPWVQSVPLFDASNDPVSPSSPDSEVSKNYDTAADCTNELTEVSGMTGFCHLVLTGTEMTADVVLLECASTGAKTALFELRPRKLPTVHSGTAAGGAAGSITLDAGASDINDAYTGMVVVGTLDSAVEVRVISAYDGSTKVASVVPDWNTTPDSDDTFVIKLPEGGRMSLADIRAVNGDAPDLIDGSNPIPADVIEIEGTDATDALATAIADLPTNAELATALGTADDAVLAQIALVKAKTDSLTFTAAGFVDANVLKVDGDDTPPSPFG